MSRKRTPSDEERALFKAAVQNPGLLAPKPATKPKTEKPKQSASKTAGLDGSTQDRLRRGLLEPEARLDLHGLTENAAHRALVTFLRGASARGLRLVIVVTGKGKPQAPDEPFEMDR